MICELKTSTGAARVHRCEMPESGPVPRVIAMGSRLFLFHSVTEHGAEFREVQSISVPCRGGLDPAAA